MNRMDKDDVSMCVEKIITYTLELAIKPTAATYYIRGLARNLLNDYRGAIEDYTKTVELDPTHENAYIRRNSAKNRLKE